MQNLLLYEEFNWSRKPKEMDAEIIEIINDIKLNFDINNLSHTKRASYNNKSFFIYTYKGQSLKIGCFNDPRSILIYYLAFLNDENITKYLSKKIIKDFYKFLKNKWDEKTKRERISNKMELKDKLKRLKNADGMIGNEEIDPLGEENWL